MEYELYHHGILGMKWGIRRYQNPDGTLTPAGKIRKAERYRYSDDEMALREIRKHRSSSLSNQELKTANERLELKRKYKKNTTPMVAAIIGAAAGAIASEYAKQYIKEGIKVVSRMAHFAVR